MEEWKEYKARDFCSSVTDGTHDSPKPNTTGHYLITSKHLKDNRIDFSSANLISEEDYQKVNLRSAVEQYDILFSMIGTIGSTVQVKQQFVDFAVKNMGIFKMGKNRLKSTWLYYWLNSSYSKQYINQRLAGSTQSYLTLDSLRNFPIAYPGDNKAYSIIAILKTLDDKIEINRRINENLEQQAQALFKSWFVDFEPFRDQPFVESELGMIPQGWKVGTLGDIIEEKAKSTIQVKQAKDVKGDYPFFTSGSAILEFTEPLVMGRNLYLNTGGVAGVKYFIGNAAYSTDTWCICGRDDYSDYLYLYLKSIEDNINSQYFEGSALKHLKKKALKSRSLILPTTTVINDFNKVVIPIFDKKNSIFFQNRVLSQLRDTLLPRLMSGELKVQEIEESL